MSGFFESVKNLFWPEQETSRYRIDLSKIKSSEEWEKTKKVIFDNIFDGASALFVQMLMTGVAAGGYQQYKDEITTAGKGLNIAIGALLFSGSIGFLRKIKAMTQALREARVAAGSTPVSAANGSLSIDVEALLEGAKKVYQGGLTSKITIGAGLGGAIGFGACVATGNPLWAEADLIGTSGLISIIGIRDLIKEVTEVSQLLRDRQYQIEPPKENQYGTLPSAPQAGALYDPEAQIGYQVSSCSGSR